MIPSANLLPPRTFHSFVTWSHAACVFQGGVLEISTESLDFSVESEKFTQDSEYAAKVRSSPNQVTHMGEWSEWSPEVYWTTWPAGDGESPQKSTKKVAYIS